MRQYAQIIARHTHKCKWCNERKRSEVCDQRLARDCDFPKDMACDWCRDHCQHCGGPNH